MFSSSYDARAASGPSLWEQLLQRCFSFSRYPRHFSREFAYWTAATVGVLALFLGNMYLSWNQQALPDSIRDSAEGEILLRVFDEMSRRFYHIMRDVSNVAQTARRNIKEAKGTAEADDEWIKQEICRVCQVAEKMQAVEQAVLLQEGWTAAALADARTRFRDNVEVRTFLEGTQKMLADALSGVEPILPGFQIPSDLTDDVLVEYRCEIQQHELEKAREFALKIKGLPPTLELGHGIASLAQKAEREIFEKHCDVLGKGGEVYLSAICLRRNSSVFAQRLDRLEDEHKQAMIRVFCG